MKTKLFFFLAAIVLFASCGPTNGPTTETDYPIEVSYFKNSASVTISKDTSIVIADGHDVGGLWQFAFDGEVETIEKSDLKVKAIREYDYSSDNFTDELCSASVGLCLSSDNQKEQIFNLSSNMEKGDICDFQAHMTLVTLPTAATDFKVKYEFYTSQKPDNKLTVSVTYKYTPAE